MVERKTLLVWRIAQFCIFICIFILELVQLSKYNTYYWSEPRENKSLIWISESISFIVIAISFWKNGGPLNRDLVLDLVLLVVWATQSFTDMIPAISGEPNCNSMTASEDQTGCRLFMGSMVLSLMALCTVLVTLALSTIRWRNGRHILPKPQQSYIVQKGSLETGEPVLLFYSKNMHKYPYNTHNLRSSITKTPPSNFINISIPEPEIAATAKDGKVIHTNFENDDDGNDNPILKYP